MNQSLTKWYRMDNAGMIYPIIGTLSNQSNFMLRFSLDTPIDPVVLQRALEATYRRFPYFRVSIERGVFRHYLADNPRLCKVWRANGLLLGRTDFKRNGSFPIRISYWSNTVFVTFFHGLSDGSGAMIFTCYLLAQYCQTVYPNDDLPDPDQLFPVQEGETEDAYVTNYVKYPFWKGLRATSDGNAAQVKGTFFVKDGLACTQGKIGVGAALSVARQMGCTLTELLAGAALLAAVRTRAVCTPKKQPKVFVPVNMRPLFGSRTMFNFAGILKCRVPQSTPTLQEYVRLIHEQIVQQNTRDYLAPQVAFSSIYSKNPLLRSMPIGPKMFISKVARGLAKSTKQTLIASNLGKVPLPRELLAKVTDFAFMLNANRRTPQNMAILSFGDTLSVTWSRRIVQNDIDREFYAILRELGLDMRVNSNYREKEYAL